MRWGGVIYNSTICLASNDFGAYKEVGAQNGAAQLYENLNKNISNYFTTGGNPYEAIWKMGGGAIGIWGGSTYIDNSETIYEGNTTKGHGGAINIGRVNVADGNYFYSSASATVTGAQFIGNNGSRGGAVMNNSSSTFLSDSNTFAENEAVSGGAIFNGSFPNSPASELNGKETLLTLKGTNTFINNSANNWGGAIVNREGKILDTVSSKTIFNGNKVTLDFYGGLGGALVNITDYEASANSIVEFIGRVDFVNNSSVYGGGAVANYSWDDSGKNTYKTSMSFKGTTLFQDNEAKGYSGGAIWNADAHLELLGTQDFVGNTAKYGWGGAIASFQSFGKKTTLLIDGTTTFKNNSAQCGGAIYTGLAVASINNATFENNKAEVVKDQDENGNSIYYGGNGGAILNGGNDGWIAESFVSNSTFKGNEALYIPVYETYAYGGGAVMNFTGSTFASLNNKYIENIAGNVGGAIHNRQGETTQLILSGINTFEGNTAKKGGGAIFNHGQISDSGESSYTEFKNNSSAEGFGGALMNVGGIYAFDGKNQENVISAFKGTVVFEGNKAKKSGGAIANLAHPTVLVVSTGKPIDPDTTYYANTKVEFGGDVLFRNNISESNGGAVYNKDGEVTFRGNNNSFIGNEALIAGALMNLQMKHDVAPAYMEVSGDALFENNKAHTAAGAVYNNANMVFGQGNHIFRGNSVEAGNGGAIYNVDTGTITFGGNNYFESNTAQGLQNDIFNKGKLVLGSEENVHNLTVLNGGITGPGSMELNTGNLVLGSGAQIHQSSFKAKAGTITTIVLSEAHHVHDNNIAHFDELADENGTGHDKVATAVTNNGFGIHTTGQMTLEKGAILNIVSDDIQAGHTYLVAYNEEAAEPQVAKMVRAAESSVVVKPAGFEHDETSWKGENLISSNPLVKLERVEGDNTNGYILVTSKNSNSISIIEDLAGLDQVYFSWLSDLEDLRQRLGEVRLGADNGIWTKVSYARYRASGLGDGKVKSTDYSIHVGADGTLYKNNGHKFFAGFSFKGGHTDMKAARAAGTGDLNHYTWKLYGTYVHEKGSYADIVASVGTFNNRFRGYHDSWTGQVHGDVNNWGAGISGEVGHQFRFLEESAGSFWFAEPQIQLSYFRVKGKNYETSNAIHVEQKSVNFLTGRVGVSAGKQFAYGADKKRYLQLSAKAGLIHEFAGDQKLRLNEKKLSADGKKNLFYYGADMDWQFADNHKLYLKVDRATGSGYRKDIQIQGGYRYSF